MKILMRVPNVVLKKGMVMDSDISEIYISSWDLLIIIKIASLKFSTRINHTETEFLSMLIIHEMFNISHMKTEV